MKFILITKQQLKEQTVNISSSAYYDRNFEEVVETVDLDCLKELIKIPPQKINLIIKGKYLTEILLRTITPCYLRGTEISINGVQFKPCKCNPQYFYIWQDKVPSTLPEHLKKAYREFNLRGDLYQELVKWNQERIAKASEKSKFKWECAEEFYKEVFKEFNPKHIQVQSPNKKTFYEGTAELDFANVVYPEESLTEEEQMYLDLAELKHYTRAFGLQDTSVMVGMHHRTTPHGSTDEPVLISHYEIEQAKTAFSFNKHDKREPEGYETEDGFKVISWNSTKSNLVTLHHKERENIQTLKWFLSQPKNIQEEFLMPGWHFCPVCGELYHELDGCYDINGNCHIEPIEIVPYNDETHDNDDEEDYEL